MSSSPGIVRFNQCYTNARSHAPQSAFPKSDGNLFEWIGTIEGAPGTVRSDPAVPSRFKLTHDQVYTSLTFKISISFPSNYPFKPPTIKFETPCYHPNVDINNGGICLDILQVNRKSTIRQKPMT